MLMMLALLAQTAILPGPGPKPEPPRYVIVRYERVYGCVDVRADSISMGGCGTWGFSADTFDSLDQILERFWLRTAPQLMAHTGDPGPAETTWPEAWRVESFMDDLVGIWDLKTGRKVELRVEKRTRVVPKHVEEQKTEEARVSVKP